jgi:hypothetical protein
MIVLYHPPILATRGIVVYHTSSIFQTMIVHSGPFSELENDFPSEILDHFPNWKVISQPRPFCKLENECPYINNISMLLPTWGVITSLSNKEVISTSPTCPLSTQTFHLGQRLYQNIYYMLISGDILENHLSPMDFITEKIVLDLNVL